MVNQRWMRVYLKIEKLRIFPKRKFFILIRFGIADYMKWIAFLIFLEFFKIYPIQIFKSLRNSRQITTGHSQKDLECINLYPMYYLKTNHNEK